MPVIQTVEIIALTAEGEKNFQTSLSQPKTNEHENSLLFFKGGDPAPPSDRATLLRLHPSHRPYLRRLSPCG